MIYPTVKINDDGNIVMTMEEWYEVTQKVYAEGYQDGCADTYAQCVAQLSSDALKVKEPKSKAKQRLTE